ncbi:MAG: hypothetical protein ACK5MJ_00865 [Alphaproteobacteria bacterium]
MKFAIRGLFLAIILLIIIGIGLLSFLASLNPQPKIERIVLPVEQNQYQAPQDSNEKVFTESVNKNTEGEEDTQNTTNTEDMQDVEEE